MKLKYSAKHLFILAMPVLAIALALTPLASTITASPSQSVSGVSYPTGSYKPSAASSSVDNSIRQAVARYNLPRWFYYAIVHRESSFNPGTVGAKGEKGLTQLSSQAFAGMPYPMGLSSPNDNHQQYGWDQGFNKGYGQWIRMSKVTRLTDPFDPIQNLDRFSSGYAVPAFYLFKNHYGLSDTEALRAVAYHWKYGMFKRYDKNETSYLGLYDRYINDYRSKVESQDGSWNGKPTY